MLSPINSLEYLIKELCSLIGNHSATLLLTKKNTFPIFPEEKGAVEGEAEIESLTFCSESLHKSVAHLMEARKQLYTIGFRYEEDPDRNKGDS